MVKNQGLFKAFECFSSTFQCKFNFQGLFKTVLYIQVYFKPMRTLEDRSSRINEDKDLLRHPVRAYLAERLLSSSFCNAASANGLFLVLEVWISCNNSIPLQITDR